MSRHGMLKYNCLVTSWLCVIVFIMDHSVEAMQVNNPPKLHFQQVLDELSQANVQAIVEDDRGYIWIGTEGGLDRYDGEDVLSFTSQSSDPHSLPDNRINDLLIDSHQNLWIATYRALALYVEKYEHFVIFNKDTTGNEDNDLDALTLFEDQHHKIWIGTNHGPYQVDPHSRILQRPQAPELKKLDTEFIRTIAAVEDQLWFGTHAGIYAWDAYQHQLEKIKIHGKAILEGKVSKILPDHTGSVWVTTLDKGLFRLDPSPQEGWDLTSYYSQADPILNDPQVVTVFQDQQAHIWVGTESLGLNLYHPDLDRFASQTKAPREKMGLKSNSICEIFQDRKGRLYLGSNHQGMFIHDPYIINFNHKDQQFGLQLKSSAVSAFLEVGEEIWIGTDGGGISVWNRENNSYRFINHAPKQKGSLGSNEVLALFKDSRGNIWSGNWNGGLNRYNPNNQQFTVYKKTVSPASIGSDRVTSIDEDKDGYLWMSTWDHGISRYNPEKDDFFNIGYIRYNDDHLSHNMTCDVEVDDLTGEIWVATVLGLDRVRMLGEEQYHIDHFLHYKNKQKEGEPSYVNVQCIFEDKDNQIWVGTKEGLKVYDRAKNDFTYFFKEDGLPSNDIRDIIQDSDNNYWITTAKGMAKMIPTKIGFLFESYHKADGLQAEEFFKNAAYKTSKGEIFIGGVNGFNHFLPKEFKKDIFPPRIQFTHFKLFSREATFTGENAFLPGHINTLKELSLEGRQSAFSIHFKGIHVTSPERTMYTYKLLGFDTDWSKLDKQQMATYTNLDPGEYHFMVKAINRDGTWSESPRSLTIHILPTWWQTWWAKTLYILGPLSLLFLFLYMRITMVRTQRKQLAVQLAYKTAELRTQKSEIEDQAAQLTILNSQKNKLLSMISHDLRSPLNSLKGLINVLDPNILNADELDKIKTDIGLRIESLGKEMMNLLEWAKSQMEGEVWQGEDFDLRPLTEEVCEVYKEVAIEKGVRLINTFSTPMMVRADPNQIRVVLRNLIGNALKFTQDQDMIFVDHRFRSGKEIMVYVSDTGIGMNEHQLNNLFRIGYNRSTQGTSGEKGVGLGLILVKEFIEKNGGQIYVESAPGTGTTFRFTLPKA